MVSYYSGVLSEYAKKSEGLEKRKLGMNGHL